MSHGNVTSLYGSTHRGVGGGGVSRKAMQQGHNAKTATRSSLSAYSSHVRTSVSSPRWGSKAPKADLVEEYVFGADNLLKGRTWGLGIAARSRKGDIVLGSNATQQLLYRNLTPRASSSGNGPTPVTRPSSTRPSTAREARGASAYMQQAATQAPLAPYPPPRLTHDGPLSQAQTSPARANFGRHGRQRAGAGARSKRPAGVSRLDVEYAASIDGGYASSIDQRTAGEAKGTHYIRNVFKPEQVMHQLIPHRFPQTREPSILH